MQIFVFGNPDIQKDSLPLKILPALREKFPAVDFRTKDPNEDFELPEGAVIIDAVAGLTAPRVFSSLDEFAPPPHVTLHDFDLWSHLRLLEKLGKLPERLRIIGLPPEISEKKAIDCLANFLPE